MEKVEGARELRLHRDVGMPRAEAWKWLTQSGYTRRWYGPFRREGDRLFITMLHEEGQPVVEGRLLAHEKERMLHLQASPDAGFDYIVALEDIPGGTRVTLRQQLKGTPDDPWFEAGWNFYLDCLVHAVKGLPAPGFEDYAPQPGEGGQEA